MRKIVDWACELFGLKATTHLRDYCNVHMPQLQSSGRHKRYVYIKSLVHDFNEILRLNGVEFHGNKLIVEIVKTPLRTIYSNNTSIESSNLLEALPNIPPFKPSNSTRSNADQPVKQKIRNSYSDAVTPNKKDILLFADSIPRKMKVKDIISKIKGGRIHLKLFPGAKTRQLIHYVKPTLDEYKYDSAIGSFGKQLYPSMQK